MENSKKRGRPSVSSKLYNDHEFVKGFIMDGWRHRSPRTVSDTGYVEAAIVILTAAAAEIGGLELIYRNTPENEYICRSILNQLGRMHYQDGFNKEDVIEIANRAIKAKKDGYTVKEIEKYIRNGRINNEW